MRHNLCEHERAEGIKIAGFVCNSGARELVLQLPKVAPDIARVFERSIASSLVGNPVVVYTFSVSVLKKENSTGKSVFLAPWWTFANGNVCNQPWLPGERWT